MTFIDANTNQPCPACLSRETTDFHRVDRVPISVGSLWSAENEARQAPVGNMLLNYCRSCRLIRNRLFDIEKVPFRPGYEVGLNHSGVFRKYLDGVAQRLIERYELHGKKILEIGCGAGYFLRLMCAKSGSDGIGIDPTVPKPGIEERGGLQIEFIQKYFTESTTNLPCDFVCSLSVFEDVPQVFPFLQNVRCLLKGRSDVGVYFEVFNAMRAFERLETFSPHYEQCNYFGIESLQNAFGKAGFEILDKGTCYQDGQYIYVEARIPTTRESSLHTDENVSELPTVISDFAAAHRATLEHWRSRLDAFRRNGSRVVLWGSGGKGISFLNELEITEEIRYVIDINPDRQGHFIPVTAQPIVAPVFLYTYKPDVVILTNPIYEEEIRGQCRAMGISTRFLHM